MSRRFLLIAAAAFVFPAAAPFTATTLYAAPEAAATGADQAQHQYLGEINANSVMIRSGSSENDYPTMKLDKGAKVTVVGMKFTWLKILPPEGSFSYITKLHVERHGDGTIGRVTKDKVSVWAGSSMTPVKSVLQCSVDQGVDVTIIGESDEYYKIKPPAGAYAWVHQNLVEFRQELNPEKVAEKTNDKGPEDKGPDDKGGQKQGPTDPIARIPATRPTTGPSDTADATTRPADVASAEAEFDRIEAAFKESEGKKLEDQPLPDLLTTYQALSKSEYLPTSMRRVVDQRVGWLQSRVKAREELIAIAKRTAVDKAKLEALKIEEKEIQENIKKNGVQSFTGIGTVQASSIQVGEGALYRLTDPANGRTTCYLRVTDAKILPPLGKFVGVRGEITTDPNLAARVILVTEVTPVDQARVNKGVTAQIIPASLLSQEASTN